MKSLPPKVGKLAMRPEIINLRYGDYQSPNSQYWMELSRALQLSESAGFVPLHLYLDGDDKKTILVDVLEKGMGPAVAIIVETGSPFMKSARRWCSRFLRAMDAEKVRAA